MRWTVMVTWQSLTNQIVLSLSDNREPQHSFIINSIGECDTPPRKSSFLQKNERVDWCAIIGWWEGIHQVVLCLGYTSRSLP